MIYCFLELDEGLEDVKNKRVIKAMEASKQIEDVIE